MKIVSFGQVFHLDSRAFINQFTVEMEGGKQAVVATNEDTINALINIAAGIQREAIQHEERDPDFVPSVYDPPPTEEDVASIFGGDVDAGELHEQPQEAEEPTTPESRPGNGGLGSGKPARRPNVDKDGFALPIRSRTVEKDEMGYPIVPRSGAPASSGDDGSDDGTQL